MDRYETGGWKAELVKVSSTKIYTERGPRHPKVRKFECAGRRGAVKFSLSYIDVDGRKEDMPVRYVLDALAAADETERKRATENVYTA